MADARKESIIPWEWIEDRLRWPRVVSMWEDLRDFSETALTSYRREVWATQPEYLEVRLEKDALSGIFEDVLGPYGATLNVGRGYDGWSSIRNAATRYEDKVVTILYFGDFDPSGEDMVRCLRERLAHFGCFPEVVKCALTAAPIIRRLSEKGNERCGFFVQADFEALLKQLPDYLQDFIRFGFLTGWRKGEIASLVWSDLDLDART